MAANAKADADSDSDTAVISFITRLGFNDAGEEEEQVLFHTPRAKRDAPYPHEQQFEFAFFDALDSDLADRLIPAAANPKLDRSTRRSYSSILANTSIPPGELLFIRRSKTLAYAGHELDVFLFRLSERYHHGLAASFGRDPLGGDMPPPAGLSLEEEEEWVANAGEYQLQEERLGLHWHRWTARGYFEQPFSIADDVMTTAFWSVFLSHELEVALFSISDAEHGLTATELVEVALEVFFQAVNSHVGQYRFKHWPPGLPDFAPEMKEIPGSVRKFRMYRYWVDVVAHFLTTAAPAHSTLLAAALLRVLQPLTLRVVDERIDTAQFELAALASIAAELARAELARTQIAKLACGRVLNNNRAPATKRTRVEVVALGGNELVYTALRELIHTVTTLAAHPYSALSAAVGPMSGADEERWKVIPREVHITIAETGPSLAGLTVARNLFHAHDHSRDESTALRDRARSRFKQLEATADDEPQPPTLADRLQHALNLHKEDGPPAGLETVGTLRALVDEAEKFTREECKVVIELVPDGAIANAVRNAGEDVVVLLGAEGVLASEAGTVCRMGARTIAECANARGKKAQTFALAPTAVFAAGPSTQPWEPTFGTTDEIFSAWEASFRNVSEAAAESITEFATAAADARNKAVRVTNQLDELVPGSLVSCWVTEAGLLSEEGCAALSKERGQAELLMFGRPRTTPDPPQVYNG